MDQSITLTGGTPAVEQFAGLIDAAPFPGFFRATVRGVDEGGMAFESDVPLDGHLDGDLYLRLTVAVAARSELFIVLRPAAGLDAGLPALRVALRGLVGRAHPLGGGVYDLRVTVCEHRPL